MDRRDGDRRRRRYLLGGFPQEVNILALNPLAWWKPDESRVTKDGTDRLSQVNDISGNTNHLLQALAAQQPLWVGNVLNGRPCMRFDDVDNNFDLTSALSPAGNYTVFVVMKPNTEITSATAPQFIFRNDTNFSPRWLMGLGAQSGNMTDETLSTFAVNIAAFTAHYIKDNISASDHILMTRLDGTTGTIEVDRDSKTIFNGVGGGLDASDVNKRMVNTNQLGDEPTQSIDGDLYEIIIFPSALSDANVILVGNYFLGQFRI